MYRSNVKRTRAGITFLNDLLFFYLPWGLNMKPDTEIMNTALYKLHRIFFIGIISFAVIMALIGIRIAVGNGEDAAIGLVGIVALPIAAAHWFAAQGVKEGTFSGKIISRIIGTLWLFGFPIGTALGIYVWLQTGKKWTPAMVREDNQA